MSVISVIIPLLNEQEAIPALLDALIPVLTSETEDYEVIFIDDGSDDQSLSIIKSAHQNNPRIRAISFSRNFGKEIAIAAGLRYAKGDAVVIMDADLQHPPETIKQFLHEWRKGNAVVYGVRNDRSSDGHLRRFLTQRFYKLFARVGQTELPEGAGDFRLLDRQVVNAFNALPERARFSKGLYAWVGYKTKGITFDVAPRFAGQSRFAAGKLLVFALDGLTSFSIAPLRLAIYLGLGVSAIALVSALYFLARTILFGTDVPGFPSLIISVMFFSGLQLIFLGVIGEYIGRIFEEVKRRPLFIVQDTIGLQLTPEDHIG